MPPIVTIEAPPRLDPLTAPGFEEFVVALVNAGASRIAIDLSQVGYLGSAGVRSLLLIAKALETCQGRLALLAPRPSTLEVLRICGLGDQLVIADMIEHIRQRI